MPNGPVTAPRRAGAGPRRWPRTCPGPSVCGEDTGHSAQLSLLHGVGPLLSRRRYAPGLGGTGARGDVEEAATAAAVSKTSAHYWLRDSGGNRPAADVTVVLANR